MRERPLAGRFFLVLTLELGPNLSPEWLPFCTARW
jgi:hypothetical protein